MLARFNKVDSKPRCSPMLSDPKLSNEDSPKVEKGREKMSGVSYASANGM